VKETELTATLLKTLPNSTPIPISGDQVNFTITQIGYGGSSGYLIGSDVVLSYHSDITDSNGKAKVYLICNKAIGKKDIFIKAEALDKTTSEVIAEQTRIVRVDDHRLYKVDFEEYPPEMDLRTEFHLQEWSIDVPDATADEWDLYYKALVDDEGANGTSRSGYLYADPNFAWSGGGAHTISFNEELFCPEPNTNLELRCFIKVGKEPLGHSPLYPDEDRQRGILDFGRPSFIFYESEYIRYHRENIIGGYGLMEWIPIRIQVVKDPKMLKYWIYGIASTPSPLNESIPLKNQFGICSRGGSVWFDEIEVYNLNGLPAK